MGALLIFGINQRWEGNPFYLGSCKPGRQRKLSYRLCCYARMPLRRGWLTPFSNLKSPLNKYLIELWQQWEWDEGLTRSCMKLIPNWMIVLLISHCMEHYYVAFVVVVSSVVIATRERHFAIFVFKDTDVWISSWIIWFFIIIFLVTFLVWILTNLFFF